MMKDMWSELAGLTEILLGDTKDFYRDDDDDDDDDNDDDK